MFQINSILNFLGIEVPNIEVKEVTTKEKNGEKSKIIDAAYLNPIKRCAKLW